MAARAETGAAAQGGGVGAGDLSSVPPAASPNIAAHLREIAARHPHRAAVVVPQGRGAAGRMRYAHFTFDQLDRDSDAVAAGLIADGVARETRAAVMVPPGLDFFSLVFGLFKAGVVPVLIDPGMGLKSLGRCLDEAEPELFIGIAKALAARRVLGWGKRTVRRTLIAGRGGRIPGFGARSLDAVRSGGSRAIAEGRVASPVMRGVGPEDPAAVLFTSGSTGPPKGAVYTHPIFEAQVACFRDLYAIEPGEIDLCTFPLFALFAPALGMTSVVPRMDPTRPAKVDPESLFEAIDDFGPTNLFGSPALLKRVGPAGTAKGMKLPTLRRVVTAGAPASPRVLETFASLLEPGAQVFTPYGATESLPVASIGSDEILGETRLETERGRGVCVGRPCDVVLVRIIRISDDPIPSWSDDLELPPGEIGEIVVSGPVVTREYFGRPEATALAKIADPARGTFHHRMGDVGYLDESGRIWFCGRKAHRVVLADETLFTICCEGVFNAHPEVARTAIVGVERPTGKVPVLCVEPARRLGRRDRARLREELLALGARFDHTRKIHTILFHRSFPVDIRHNSKIFREKLATWAAGKAP
ncbi:fatty acid CoA ligase family protein [Planctomyces sp. SH-PL62]|uniref:fatty acid CoA ligase family protein n=1 Tax=Planctomyces sp. SH-PL62 TaxID=1636152 RepID=UPI00078B9B41|nr:fatty acid CoA ligase family protein [Planctomyces sp. SH-PL62]AMV37007.1 Long-chain-fatty-acid--CoA ligase [Planctomyces sp. SH-PL62]